jgi:hypothetical protein
MHIEDARKLVEQSDMDSIKLYAQEIASSTEDALNGDDDAIRRIKNGLRAWAVGESHDLPPRGFLQIAALHFLGSDEVLPVRRAREVELPDALDAANIAYQAVCNDADRSDKLAPFKVRIEQFIRNNWPEDAFSDDMIKSICKIANRDKKTGPKRRRSL